MADIAIPAALDLRRRGWRLRRDSPRGPSDACPVLVVPRALSFARWLALTRGGDVPRELTVVLGIEDPHERSRLLRLGFGEVLGWFPSLEELGIRAERVAARAQAVERRRRIGALTLDLLVREGFVAERPLRLFPREFALLWRLSDLPGHRVAAQTLLEDVWGLSFRPETNSLAVHVSRLRAKLRIAGMDGFVETTEDGGYRLAVGPLPAQSVLDAARRLRKDASQYDEHSLGRLADAARDEPGRTGGDRA